MKVRLLALVLIGAFLSGCASTAGSRRDQLDAMVDAANKAVVVDKYGLPDKRLDLDASEIWEYKLNLHNYTSPTGYRFSTYDLLRLTFKDEMVSSWSLESEVK